MSAPLPQHDHHTALRLFVASVWLILLTFYMFIYNIDASLFIFQQGFILLFTVIGLGLFGLTYWLLKQSFIAPAQEDRRTPAQKILDR
ncbi:MAG: hypothetical protein WCV86_02075 [Patescibacteria group bacterium]|jgi:hypothetical protein